MFSFIRQLDLRIEYMRVVDLLGGYVGSARHGTRSMSVLFLRNMHRFCFVQRICSSLSVVDCFLICIFLI